MTRATTSQGKPAELVVDAGPAPAEQVPAARLWWRCAPPQPRGARRARRGGLPPAGAARRVRLVELTRCPRPRSRSRPGSRAVLCEARLRTEWVDDAPGLVLGRIVCQLVNEAWFAIGEGVGAADDVDGDAVGLGHPRGPVAWGETMGSTTGGGARRAVVGPPRGAYRPAPLLTRRAAHRLVQVRRARVPDENEAADRDRGRRGRAARRGARCTPSVQWQRSTFEGFEVISYVPEQPRGMRLSRSTERTAAPGSSIGSSHRRR